MTNPPVRPGLLVPYVTAWSEERALPTAIVEVPGRGIRYADEVVGDRDQHGVLWPRLPSRPGHGHPRFGVVHSLRQRRAMRRLLCQVCAGPADRNEQGVLFLLVGKYRDWPDWPEDMACTDPPICRRCARIAVKACPALRATPLAVRVGHCPISAVRGIRYHPGPASEDIVTLTDPAIRWTRAEQLIRKLTDCTILDLDQL